VSKALAALHDWNRRTKGPGPHNTDPHFQYHTTVLRELLTRLEIVLADEGVDEETALRVIRGMIYGSPHASDAVLRAAQQQQITELVQHQTTVTVAPGITPEDYIKRWLQP
jgi:hypothetical protein